MGGRSRDVFGGPLLLWAGCLLGGLATGFVVAQTTGQRWLTAGLALAAIAGVVSSIGLRWRWAGWSPVRNLGQGRVMRATVVAMAGWWICALLMSGGPENRGPWVAGGLLGLALSLAINLWWDRAADLLRVRRERSDHDIQAAD